MLQWACAQAPALRQELPIVGYHALPHCAAICDPSHESVVIESRAIDQRIVVHGADEGGRNPLRIEIPRAGAVQDS